MEFCPKCKAFVNRETNACPECGYSDGKFKGPTKKTGLVIASAIIGIVIIGFFAYFYSSDFFELEQSNFQDLVSSTYKSCTMITYGTKNVDLNCPGLDTLYLVRELPLKAAEVDDVTLSILNGMYNVRFETPLGMDVSYDLTNPNYESKVYSQLTEILSDSEIFLENLGVSLDELQGSLQGVPLMMEQIIKESSESVVIPKIEVPEIEIPEIEIPTIEPPTPLSLEELKQIALEDINKYRTEAGLRAVKLGIAKSPQLYAEELLKEGCIHHISDRGEGPMLRYKNNRDKMFLVAENIAGGLGTRWDSPQDEILRGNYDMMFDDAHSNWGHRDNILNPHHHSVSIGIVYDFSRLVMIQDFEQPLPPGYSYHPSSFQKQPVDERFCW